MGWGWTYTTDPRYLASGSHFFDIQIPAAQMAGDADADIGSYKLQLFGR
jgi:hypothetical protein